MIDCQRDGEHGDLACDGDGAVQWSAHLHILVDHWDSAIIAMIISLYNNWGTVVFSHFPFTFSRLRRESIAKRKYAIY